ncbi:MAG TPA: NADH-quinone oxidoreductase subunit M [Stellaceae bacterium]|jgi:NADH-quinone oxidoreductase subunit M|nr:NADH-quinone oxidoreductase subunit M [Stellaceae bacterium]
MSHWPLLTLVTFLPLVGVGFIMTARGDDETVARNARNIALSTSLIVFALSLLLWLEFDPNTADFQFVEQARWISIGGFSINYHMGIDGISLFFVLLSTLLTPICIGASWISVHSQVREYMISFLVLETMMVGIFCALDFLLFYTFFEGVLVPMFVIIGIWGGPRRIYASFKFFLYTLLGSLLSLLAILTIYFNMQPHTTDIATVLATAHFDPALQKWLWLAFFASFAVKVPMWPVHTWLPDAHVEAPTAGSVILAGVLLKLGGYGFIRFSLPMLPLASAYFTPLMFALSAIAVIYTSFVALAQTDMKKLIAYSSIAHMGFVTMGIFAVTREAVDGAMIQMLSHGLVSAALFLCVGVVYDRLHTRDIDRYGGLADRMPSYGFVFMCFMLASIGLPGTSGFVGEFLILLGTFRVSTLECFLAATALFLGAMYMLYLYRRIIFGTITRDDLRNMLDLSPREKAVFAPLLLLTLWMGVYPSSFLKPIGTAVDHLVQQVGAARQAALATEPSVPARRATHLADAAHVGQGMPVAAAVGGGER